MSSQMGANRYGKDGIRLVTVHRHAGRHDLRDLTIDVRMEGDYSDVYTRGDNSPVLPTDTMRSTVYALAPEHLAESIELFGRALAERFLAAAAACSRVEVSLTEHQWQPIEVSGRPHPHAFSRSSGERWTALVTAQRGGSVDVRAGLKDLLVMKTAGSAFSGFLRDEYTVLADTDDRLLATSITCAWDYAGEQVRYDACRNAVRASLLAAFADHESQSVQHTLHVMGSAVIAAVPEVDRIHLALPNRHHHPVDLTQFGLADEGEVYVATDRPYGVIEGTVVRSGTREN